VHQAVHKGQLDPLSHDDPKWGNPRIKLNLLIIPYNSIKILYRSRISSIFFDFIRKIFWNWIRSNKRRILEVLILLDYFFTLIHNSLFSFLLYYVYNVIKMKILIKIKIKITFILLKNKMFIMLNIFSLVCICIHSVLYSSSFFWRNCPKLTLSWIQLWILCQ